MSTSPAFGFASARHDRSSAFGWSRIERSWRALANPNAGEVLVSAAAGWEFADLGGRHHLGGGSHGSLDAGDSEVPVLTVGLDGEPRSITELAPLALGALGVSPPAYAPPLGRAA